MVDFVEMNKKPATIDRSMRVHSPLNLPSKLAAKTNVRNSSNQESSIELVQHQSLVAAYRHALITTQVRCSEILDPLSSLQITINGNASALTYLEN